MKRFHGTQAVGPGIYFNPRQFSFKSVERNGELPGTTDDHYVAVPWAVMITVGPVLGLAYVVFLPFIGVAMVVWLLAGKINEWTTSLARRVSRVLKPGWEPSLAYLSRSRNEKAGDDPVERDAWSDAVHSKLAEESAHADEKVGR